MLCQKCKKNSATVHLVKLVNGEKSDIWLCEECAKKIAGISLEVPMVSMSEEQFQNILGDFFDTIDKKNQESKPLKELNVDIICKNCGLTYSKFKQTGKLGCPECYSSFRDLIDEEIEKVQGSTINVGKTPKINEKYNYDSVSIDKLREELKKAVIEEKYEKAALLRDKIKNLQKTSEGAETYEKLDS